MSLPDHLHRRLQVDRDQGVKSEKPSGTDVDYHVKSKADKLDGPAPLKIHFTDESSATKRGSPNWI